jgi:hypothetical protein
VKPPPEVVADVTQRSILMLCDGRARAGWAILVVGPNPADSTSFEVHDVSPGQAVPVPAEAELEVLMPGFMLSGFDKHWTVWAQQAPGDADFSG